MKIILAALLAVSALGLAGSAYALTIPDTWTGHAFVNDAGEDQAWFWNPDDHTITNVDPDKEFTITQVGNWDVIEHEGFFHIHEYLLNNTRVNLNNGNYIPALLWIEDQLSKIWKYVNLHDKQIESMQEEIDSLQDKLASQAKRIKVLEKAIEPVPVENLPFP